MYIFSTIGLDLSITGWVNSQEQSITIYFGIIHSFISGLN